MRGELAKLRGGGGESTSSTAALPGEEPLQAFGLESVGVVPRPAWSERSRDLPGE